MQKSMKIMNLNNICKYTNKLLKNSSIAIRPQSTDTYSNKNALNYCAKIVRQHDYESFLATLLLTKAIRSPALVVRAFNVEVARIQDQTSDPQTAAFRLQFWEDTLINIYKKGQSIENVPANPIAQELFKICSCYTLPKRHLERLITSRSGLLQTKYFRSIEDVERYAEDAVSPIYYMLLNVAGVNNIHADHAASHLGKAQGITNILRSVFVSNHHKMISMPMETLMKHGISQEQVLRGADSNEMRNVTFEIASRANTHLQKARSINIPSIAKQIFLPAVSVDAYLTKLQKCSFNAFDKSLQTQNTTLPFRLYLKRFLNKY